MMRCRFVCFASVCSSASSMLPSYDVLGEAEGAVGGPVTRWNRRGESVCSFKKSCMFGGGGVCWLSVFSSARVGSLDQHHHS